MDHCPKIKMMQIKWDELKWKMMQIQWDEGSNRLEYYEYSCEY